MKTENKQNCSHYQYYMCNNMNMEELKLCSLGLGIDCVSVLDKKMKQTTVKEFLYKSPLDVMSNCAITYPQYLIVRDTVSNCIAPPPSNVLSMYSTPLNCLPTNITGLDTRGGLLPGTITEICGPPGAGKTQFCLTMAAICSRPRQDGRQGLKTIYIDTEGSFSAHRLMEICRHQCTGSAHNQQQVCRQVAMGVVVHTELTCEALHNRLALLEEEVESSGCGLVCVDSIASVVRREVSTNTIEGTTHRNAVLYHYVKMLKHLAEKYNLVVVVSNQIMGNIRDSLETDWSSRSGGVVCPSLGNTWFHCVNTRLMLEMDDVAMGTRKVHVVKSPVLGNVTLPVQIGSKGLTDRTQ